MRWLSIRFILVFVLCFPLSIIAHPATLSVNGKASSIAPMIARVTPSIVNISVLTTPPPPPPFSKMPPPATGPQNGPGTSSTKHQGGYDDVGAGVIFNAKKGLIVTNAHVIANEKNYFSDH